MSLRNRLDQLFEYTHTCRVGKGRNLKEGRNLLIKSIFQQEASLFAQREKLQTEYESEMSLFKRFAMTFDHIPSLPSSLF